MPLAHGWANKRDLLFECVLCQVVFVLTKGGSVTADPISVECRKDVL